MTQREVNHLVLVALMHGEGPGFRAAITWSWWLSCMVKVQAAGQLAPNHWSCNAGRVLMTLDPSSIPAVALPFPRHTLGKIRWLQNGTQDIAHAGSYTGLPFVWHHKYLLP